MELVVVVATAAAQLSSAPKPALNDVLLATLEFPALNGSLASVFDLLLLLLNQESSKSLVPLAAFFEPGLVVVELESCENGSKLLEGLLVSKLVAAGTAANGSEPKPDVVVVVVPNALDQSTS